MGQYSVPDNIRKLRPAGTTVKAQKGHYYVYEYKSTSVKEVQPDGTSKWKTKTVMGACIGYITLEEGFVSNKNKLAYSDITVFEYGAYLFIKEYAGTTLTLLKKTFHPNEATQIFSLAAAFLVNKFQNKKNVARLFEVSVLSKWFPNVQLGRTALDNLYEKLGRHGQLPDTFQQSLIDHSSKRVAIDGHVIACSAEKGDLSAFGYKAKKLGTAQVNWMSAYDVQTGAPLCNEMFNGSDPDKTAIQVLFSRFSFTDTLFLVDRGFNTAKDKKLMSENGNTYIVPMISGRTDYNQVYAQLKFDKRRSFIYDKNGYSSVIRYSEYSSEDKSVRYFAFLDTTRQSAERQTYLKKMKNHEKGYTEEGLLESEKDFGLFLLETNDNNKKAVEVFTDYKARWSIETFYDYIDNDVDVNALCLQDYCEYEGLGFIIQVCGMIYHDLKAQADEQNLSMKDIMSLLKGIKLVKERDRYVVRNDNKERRELSDRLKLKLENHGVNVSPT